MLASLFRSKYAIQINISIMRALTQSRNSSSHLRQSKQESMKVQYILERYDSRISHLENQLCTQLPITGPTTVHSKINYVNHLLQIVAQYWEIQTSDLRSGSRAQTFVIPRQIAIYLIRKTKGLSFKEIGTYFGKRDHSTILHGYRKICEELKKNKDLQKSLSDIQKMLSNPE